jgi:hypothetical protein
VLAKALITVLRWFHGIQPGIPNSNKTKQSEQEDPMPEAIIRSHGSRPSGSVCRPTLRMCGVRSARQRRLPRY